MNEIVAKYISYTSHSYTYMHILNLNKNYFKKKYLYNMIKFSYEWYD